MADAAEFGAPLHAALPDGLFRLVLVLDTAGQELVKVVGCLDDASGGCPDMSFEQAT